MRHMSKLFESLEQSTLNTWKPHDCEALGIVQVTHLTAGSTMQTLRRAELTTRDGNGAKNKIQGTGREDGTTRKHTRKQGEGIGFFWTRYPHPVNDVAFERLSLFYLFGA